MHRSPSGWKERLSKKGSYKISLLEKGRIKKKEWRKNVSKSVLLGFISSF